MPQTGYKTDAKTDGGIGFDGGEVMVDTGDLGMVLSDLDNVNPCGGRLHFGGDGDGLVHQR